MEELLKELFMQQNKFAEQLVAGQSVWMKSLIQNGNNINNTVPPFQKFDKEKQRWDAYLQQLQQHFHAYNVVEVEKQKSFFLSWIGSDIFELLKNLFGTDSLQEKTFSELTGKLTDHFKTKTHVVAARFEFNKCTMKTAQTYKEWVATLRGIARDCEFSCGSHEYIDEMIRDQIILHTPHDSVRTAALQKLKPTLAEVLLIAESFEATTTTLATLKDKLVDDSPICAVTSKSRKITNNNNYNNNRNNGLVSKKKGMYKSCSGCFSSHSKENCKFKTAICNRCGKKGHIAPVCMSTDTSYGRTKNKYQKHQSVNTNNIEVREQIFNISDNIQQENNKSFINLSINKKRVKFQMDSGASVSIITLDTYEQLGSPSLNVNSSTLLGFGNNNISTLGEFRPIVVCGKKQKEVTLVVANVRNSNNLFGADLFKEFGYKICKIQEVSASSTLNTNELCEKYAEVFKPALGTIKNFKANILLKPDAVPKFIKSRPVPYALLPAFKKEAERLTSANIWKPISFSEWASPIVLAKKPDGSIRICGDFKTTVNTQISIEHYPLPKREDLFHTVRYGKLFSKIDLKDAYLQMELHDDAKKILVVSTPLGLFQYQQLAYGIASAPAIFQKYIEQLLASIEGCGNYLDDIIVTAATTVDHLARLDRVFTVLLTNGIRCKREKCSFLQSEIQYLGRRISANGILPDEQGLKAIKELPHPKDIKQVEAFMGKINYYHNFIPNYSHIAAPINQLRRKNMPFSWGQQQQQAFDKLKLCILNATQLAHFQEHLPLVLATDASSYGIGAVLSHMSKSGERPIAFASKTLDVHQQKYSQIEKEALSIIFGVKRFHQYLYGKKFLLLTDHDPLVSIFSPNKQLPTMTANRLQRWAIILMAYQFDIKYRNTRHHANADALSRLPVGPDTDFDQQESCYNIQELELPVNAELIRMATKEDVILKRVEHFVKHGWPKALLTTDADLLPYCNRKFELSFQNGLLCLQNSTSRVVIPSTLRKRVLQILHNGHWGIVRVKQLARKHCWWPNIDRDIKEMIDNCEICQQTGADPPREYSSWPQPFSPWERIHIDFAGPIFESMWLICVDAYSNFPFVVKMTTTTSVDTIRVLSSIFALEGLPKYIVSDNGPQLTSSEFKQFCSINGIQHLTSAPFHPASNGLAERFVRTFKTSVHKIMQDGLSVVDALLKFLSTYRTLPNKNGTSPAELLHGRPHRSLVTQLSSFEPHKKEGIINSKAKFCLLQQVYARNYARGPKWVPGEVVTLLGGMVYRVRTENGFLKRHVNQLKPRNNQTHRELNVPIAAPVPALDEQNNDSVINIDSDTNDAADQESSSPIADKPVLRRGSRQRFAVQKYQCEDFRK